MFVCWEVMPLLILHHKWFSLDDDGEEHVQDALVVNDCIGEGGKGNSIVKAVLEYGPSVSNVSTSLHSILICFNLVFVTPPIFFCWRSERFCRSSCWGF